MKVVDELLIFISFQIWNVKHIIFATYFFHMKVSTTNSYKYQISIFF